MAISGERVRRLEQKAMLHRRKKERIQILESVLKEYAYGLFASQDKEINRQAAQGTGRSKNNPAAVEKGAKACEFEIRTDKDDGFAIVHRPSNKKERPEILVTESNAKRFRDAFDHATKTPGWKFSTTTREFPKLKKRS